MTYLVATFISEYIDYYEIVIFTKSDWEVYKNKVLSIKTEITLLLGDDIEDYYDDGKHFIEQVTVKEISDDEKKVLLHSIPHPVICEDKEFNRLSINYIDKYYL